MAHRIHEAVIVLRQIPVYRNFFLSIDLMAGNILAEQLGISQHRFRCQKGGRDSNSHQMKSVHMVFQHPMPDHFQNIRLLHFRREVELHNQFYPCTMQGLHQIFEFLLRMA